MDNENKVVEVKSVRQARSKHIGENNGYIRKYGQLLWSAALLTAYQGGGMKELADNYNKVPYKYVALLLDAYTYINDEEEYRIFQATSTPHAKKKDQKAYIERLQRRLEGNGR